jgi:hypothetical protein
MVRSFLFACLSVSVWLPVRLSLQRLG